MTHKEKQNTFSYELSEADKIHITEAFYQEISPKLGRLSARMGNLNCDFAGEPYKHWNLRFRSVGAGFEIVAFEYDEDGSGFSLDT